MYVCMYDDDRNDALEIMVQCMHTSWCIGHLAMGQVDRISQSIHNTSTIACVRSVTVPMG